MRKIALLIGNSDGLEGVKIDLVEWEKFLISPIGGAWERNEIKMIMNPQKCELLSYINELRKTKAYDFAIVVYSGHGGYDRQTILEINKQGETINETDLFSIAPKQISVFDCCRCLVDGSEPINESQRTFSSGGILTNLQKIRNAYNQRIRLAIPQQVCLYACRIGETALDTESGALYIQTLLWQAKLFPNNEEFRTVEEIHKNASELTYIKGLLKKHTQHPAASLPKCLTSQKLILSINPNRI
jgi:hypothetical protein